MTRLLALVAGVLAMLVVGIILLIRSRGVEAPSITVGQVESASALPAQLEPVPEAQAHTHAQVSQPDSSSVLPSPVSAAALAEFEKSLFPKERALIAERGETLLAYYEYKQ